MCINFFIIWFSLNKCHRILQCGLITLLLTLPQKPAGGDICRMNENISRKLVTDASGLITALEYHWT